MKVWLVSLLVIFLSGTAVAAQSADTRTYDQIAAAANKTVVDYFLLCPSVIAKTYLGGQPAELALAGDEDKLDIKGADLAFRKKLLARSGSAPEVKSVVIDIANAYIKVEGTNLGRNPFTLVFVYFERADKSRIPALTYHYTAMEEEEFFHLFFDVRDGSWKSIPDEQLLPPISEKPLIPYAGQGDTKTTRWYLDELPRHGTTIRFRATRTTLEDRDDPALAAADSYLERLSLFALECPWDKSHARFMAPQPVVAARTDLPTGSVSAADIFLALPPFFTADLGMNAMARRQARDAWKAAAHAASYFEWDNGAGPDSCGAEVKILGQYRGLPLVAFVERAQEVFNLSVLLYHADTGLFEQTSLLAFAANDFYKGARASQAEKQWGSDPMPCAFSVSEDDPAVSVQLDAIHDPEIGRFPPDVSLTFRWDDASASFKKTEHPAE